MQINAIPDGTYRIRQAGAKSEVANLISNGKKCLYVQIGAELFNFDSLEDAKEFVAGKDLIADRMSLDFGVVEPAPVEDDKSDGEAEAAATVTEEEE